MIPEVFKQVKPGDWQQPIPRGYLMQCCDCGLVHRVDFRVIKVNRGTRKGKRYATIQGERYRVQLRAWRA